METPLAFMLAVLSAPICAASQSTFTEVLRSDDPLNDGSGQVYYGSVDVDVNNRGDWVAQMNTDGPDSSDMVAVYNHSIIWREGTSLGMNDPLGRRSLGYLDSIDVNNHGEVMFITRVRPANPPGPSPFLLVWNGAIVIETGLTLCHAAGVPGGAVYTGVKRAWQNSHRQLLVLATVDTGAAEVDIMLRLSLDMAGAISSETKLAMVGEMMPGPNHVTPVQALSSWPWNQTIKDSGECIWIVDDFGGSPGNSLSDTNLYVTDSANVHTLIYNEADPFPTEPSETFLDLHIGNVDLNNRGDFSFVAFDSGSHLSNAWLLRRVDGATEALAHVGDPVPASVPGDWLVAIGTNRFGGHVPMSDAGDVLWYLSMVNPAGAGNRALMLNDQLLMLLGTEVFDGKTASSLPSSPTSKSMSDNGRYAIMRLGLEDATLGMYEATVLATLAVKVGSSYCAAAPNSTGLASSTSATGSRMIGVNHLDLLTTELPVGAFGFYVTSQTQGFTAQPGGSAGNLCLGGNIGRFVGPGQIQTVDADGTFGLSVDLESLPQPMVSQAAQSGETWSFQAWHRDSQGGMTTSNFSDGLAITFI